LLLSFKKDFVDVSPTQEVINLMINEKNKRRHVIKNKKGEYDDKRETKRSFKSFSANKRYSSINLSPKFGSDGSHKLQKQPNTIYADNKEKWRGFYERDRQIKIQDNSSEIDKSISVIDRRSVTLESLQHQHGLAHPLMHKSKSRLQVILVYSNSSYRRDEMI